MYVFACMSCSHIKTHVHSMPFHSPHLWLYSAQIQLSAAKIQCKDRTLLDHLKSDKFSTWLKSLSTKELWCSERWSFRQSSFLVNLDTKIKHLTHKQSQNRSLSALWHQLANPLFCRSRNHNCHESAHFQLCVCERACLCLFVFQARQPFPLHTQKSFVAGKAQNWNLIDFWLHIWCPS